MVAWSHEWWSWSSCECTLSNNLLNLIIRNQFQSISKQASRYCHRENANAQSCGHFLGVCFYNSTSTLNSSLFEFQFYSEFSILISIFYFYLKYYLHLINCHGVQPKGEKILNKFLMLKQASIMQSAPQHILWKDRMGKAGMAKSCSWWMYNLCSGNIYKN